jgi:hypothetical protein
MVLFLQTGAFLVAGTALAAASRSKAGPAAIARAIALIAICFGYIAFWGHFWQIDDSFRKSRSSWEALSPAEAAVAGAASAEPGMQASFAEWIRGRIRPGERFYLVPTLTRDEAVYQWFSYRLLPNLMSERPTGADWLVFYGATPRSSGLAGIVSRPIQYAPNYSIARVRLAR